MQERPPTGGASQPAMTTAHGAVDGPQDVRDRLARPLRDLRISVTDRCNLRCPYCLPREAFRRGFTFMPHEELLSFEEIARVCQAFARLGVRKLRLTGGEPLLRRDLERLVEMLAAIEGVEDIALTTNGTLLAAKAASLASAGLNRVTVSLDALDAATLEAMSGARLEPEHVLEGIEAAQAAGLHPIKVNMVVRRGINDHRVPVMAEHFRHRRQTLRFIEYMDVGTSNEWRRDEVVPSAEVLAAIAGLWPLEGLPGDSQNAVATRYRYLDGAGEIGVISSITSPFCGGCSRARMSAEGKLYTCLFATEGLDLRALLREGIEDGALGNRLRQVWGARSDRYSAERAVRAPTTVERDQGRDSGRPRRRIEMSYIGG